MRNINPPHLNLHPVMRIELLIYRAVNTIIVEVHLSPQSIVKLNIGMVKTSVQVQVQ